MLVMVPGRGWSTCETIRENKLLCSSRLVRVLHVGGEGKFEGLYLLQWVWWINAKRMMMSSETELCFCF